MYELPPIFAKANQHDLCALPIDGYWARPTISSHTDELNRRFSVTARSYTIDRSQNEHRVVYAIGEEIVVAQHALRSLDDVSAATEELSVRAIESLVESIKKNPHSQPQES